MNNALTYMRNIRTELNAHSDAANKLIDRAVAAKKDLSGPALAEFNELQAKIKGLQKDYDGWLAKAEATSISPFNPSGLTATSPESSQWGLTPASGVKQADPVAVDLNRFGGEIKAFMQGQIMSLDTPVYIGTGSNVESVGATVPTSVLNALAAYGNVDSFGLAGARQLQTDNTQPLTVPVISSGAAASTFAEGASATDSQPFNLASFTFGGTKYSRLVKVSEEALMNSGIDLSGTILDELADGVASTFTAAVTTAMLTALTGNSAVLVAQGSNDFYTTLGSLLHAIPSRFAGVGNKWMLSRATLAKVKDSRATGSGVPLFDPVSQQIFGRDIVLNDSLSGGQVVFGDWFNGSAVRKTPFRIQRLVEAFASAGEVGFKATQWLDSKFLASLSGVTNQPLHYTVLTLS